MQKKQQRQEINEERNDNDESSQKRTSSSSSSSSSFAEKKKRVARMSMMIPSSSENICQYKTKQYRTMTSKFSRKQQPSSSSSLLLSERLMFLIVVLAICRCIQWNNGIAVVDAFPMPIQSYHSINTLKKSINHHHHHNDFHVMSNNGWKQQQQQSRNCDHHHPNLEMSNHNDEETKPTSRIKNDSTTKTVTTMVVDQHGTRQSLTEGTTTPPKKTTRSNSNVVRAAVIQSLLSSSSSTSSSKRVMNHSKPRPKRNHTGVGVWRSRKSSVGGGSSTVGGKVMSALRRTVTVRAAVAAPPATSESTSSTTSTPSSHDETTTVPKQKTPSSQSSFESSLIESTINDLLQRQDELRAEQAEEAARQNDDAYFKNEQKLITSPLIPPYPGTILLHPPNHFHKSTTTTVNDISDLITIRIATLRDDFAIANLRLSVFSNFSREERDQFRNRSCHVLSKRRDSGAVCLVATVPRALRGDFMAWSRNRERGMMMKYRMPKRDLDYSGMEEDWVVGSVEVSMQEFRDTMLGMTRLEDTILYITEVAVVPEVRRCGVGKKLLQGIDELATIRNIETLFLHVDVKNEAAIHLYDKCGYYKLERNAVHDEFTRSLNLHDGATMGRCHHLFCKDLKDGITKRSLPEDYKQKTKAAVSGGIGEAFLRFDILGGNDVMKRE